jgi:hypothetical protein
MTASKKWYDQPLLVFFLCFVAYPVGIYAVWKSTQYRQVYKVLYTVLFGFCAIIMLASLSKTKSEDDIPLTDEEKAISLKELLANSNWIAVDSLEDAFSTGFEYHNAAILLNFTNDEATLEVPNLRATFKLASIVHKHGTHIASKEPKFTWDYDIDEDDKTITLDNGLFGDDITIKFRYGKLYWSQWRHVAADIVFIRR